MILDWACQQVKSFWLNGPYECGMWNGNQIFHNSLLSHLEKGELVGADDGYV